MELNQNQNEQQMYDILGFHDFEVWKRHKIRQVHLALISQAKKNLRTNPDYKNLLKALRDTTKDHKKVRETKRRLQGKIQELIEEEVDNLKGVK